MWIDLTGARAMLFATNIRHWLPGALLTPIAVAVALSIIYWLWLMSRAAGNGAGLVLRLASSVLQARRDGCETTQG
jgi:hypothetical protein